MKQQLIPHLHLFLNKAKVDPDFVQKSKLVTELLKEDPTELASSGHLFTIWKRAGLTFEYTAWTTDDDGEPVWTMTAVNMYTPVDDTETYPGPTPLNLELGMSPATVVAELKQKPTRSGQVHGSGDQWQRFYFDTGGIKCSFSDGKRNPDGTTARSVASNDGKNRYSAALSNKEPCYLQLVYQDRALAKMTFLTVEATQQIDSLNEAATVHCKPCVENLCSKRLFYSSPASLEKLKARDAIYDRYFNSQGPETKSACCEILHEYRTDMPNIDVLHFVPIGIDRPFHTYVTSGLSDYGMHRHMASGPGSRASSRPSSPGSELSMSRRASVISSRSQLQIGRSLSRARLNLEELDPSPCSRVEVLFYCDKPRARYLQWLRLVAQQAFEPHARFLQAGTIIRCPSDLSISLPHGSVENFVLMHTNLRPDASISGELSIDEEPVNFLLLVPITAQERARLNDLVERLRRVSSAVVFSNQRPSYVQ